MNARPLFSLVPWMRRPAETLYQLGAEADPSVRVTSARRSHAEQARLYARFLRGESHGIPALPPGHSMHEKGRAFDLARPGVDPFSDQLLPQLGALWNSWGGLWHSSDPVHFEA